MVLQFGVPPLLDLLVSVLIAVRPTTLWRLSALIVHGVASSYLILILVGRNPEDYFFRVTVATQFFNAYHLIWLSDPLLEYRYEHDRMSPLKRSFLYRVYWATCISLNYRGVGTNHQLPYTPPPPKESGWSFVRSRLLRALALFIVVDVGHTYHSINPAFAPGSPCKSPLTCQGYILGVINLLVSMCVPYATINLGYDLISGVGVAIGITEAKRWPNFFGPLSECYSIRRFWGRFWHQMMRRFVSSIGRDLARSLGFSPGTNLSSVTQVIVAFIISGIIHTAGDLHMGKDFFGLSFKFFFLQALVILFEDTIIDLVKKTGITLSPFSTRLIGYNWVFLWFTLLMPSMMKWCIDVGFTTAKLLPFSPTMMVLEALEKHYGVHIPSYFIN